MITNNDIYTEIKILHEETKIPRIEEIILEHGKNFYNNLTLETLQHIKNTRTEDIPYKVKCKLPQMNFI